MSSGHKAKERVYSGVGVAPVIAIGQVYIADAETLKVPNYRLGEEDVPGELERLRQALDKSRRQLKALQRKSSNLPPAAAEEITYILEAYLHMLTGSRLVRGAVEGASLDVLFGEGYLKSGGGVPEQSLVVLGGARFDVRRQVFATTRLLLEFRPAGTFVQDDDLDALVGAMASGQTTLLVNLSGRGDKDLATLMNQSATEVF